MESPSYILVWLRDRDKAYILEGTFSSQEEVIQQRKLSGTLVYDADTRKIVKEDWWLFPWEKEQEGCYARRAQAEDPSLGKWIGKP